jgi:hypothetical protein
MVADFFKNLLRQRVNAVKANANAKVMGVQAKARAKAAGAVNKKIKAAGDKAKGAATGQKKDAGDKKKPKGEKMGWFGRKKGDEASAEGSTPIADPLADKTTFMQVVEERPKECVGWVVVLNGALQGHDFRLVTGKNLMGTAADCDIVLTDQYMSSRHAVIRHEEGTFTLVDLDSTNGSYTNGDRCSKQELIDNDRVRLGRTELKFKSLY